MTGRTHRQYGIFVGYVIAIYSYTKGEIRLNYYIALVIIMWASRFGAAFPDLDHDWSNIREKNLVNRIINIVIHSTMGKHRSWQTHSWDICLYCMLASKMFIGDIGLNDISQEVLNVILLGFYSGWVSHLFSDMLTSEGVRLTCLSNFRVRLVPKRFFGIKFATSTAWEDWNYTAMRIINDVLTVIGIGYPFFRV